MPGAGSALDRQDWQLLDALRVEMRRIANELERLNDALEEDGE